MGRICFAPLYRGLLQQMTENGYSATKLILWGEKRPHKVLLHTGTTYGDSFMTCLVPHSKSGETIAYQRI